MNELKIFENDDFGQVRVVQIDGDPWFVASDVCKPLGLWDVSKATSRLDEDELTRIKIVSGGQLRELLAVNEPGLYSLVLGSRKPAAKLFRRWITHEVIPSIRKTGTYLYKPHEMSEMEILSRAVLISDAKIKELTEQIEELIPKAEYYDEMLNSDELLPVTQIAKEYGLSGTELNRILHSAGVQYKTSGKWHLYQKYANMGLAENGTFPIIRTNGYIQSNTYLCWTQKGRRFINNLLAKRGIYPHPDTSYID